MRIHKRKTAAALWPKYSWAIDSINNNARLNEWHKKNLVNVPHFSHRFELHRHVRAQLSEPIDYLEFGVFEGRSLKLWTEINSSGDSRFFGFDTFTGLPEKWELGSHSMDAGHFAVDQLPKLGDSRVTLIKGLFQETLPGFLTAFERHGPMVVHCDADLYSSTLYLLTQVSAKLRVGDVIIFDEFSQPLHEYRAFLDWTQSYRIRYKAIGSSEDYHRQIAIQIVE